MFIHKAPFLHDFIMFKIMPITKISYAFNKHDPFDFLDKIMRDKKSALNYPSSIKESM